MLWKKHILKLMIQRYGVEGIENLGSNPKVFIQFCRESRTVGRATLLVFLRGDGNISTVQLAVSNFRVFIERSGLPFFILSCFLEDPVSFF